MNSLRRFPVARGGRRKDAETKNTNENMHAPKSTIISLQDFTLNRNNEAASQPQRDPQGKDQKKKLQMEEKQGSTMFGV